MGSCALVKWSMCDWDAVSTDYGTDSHWGILINSIVYVLGRTILCQEGKQWRFVCEGYKMGRQKQKEGVTWLNMTAAKIKWDLIDEI